uniref:Uncharacterized protein n=1 Tax=Trichobilharzia regenti TaxID=157069 RepID=A0AA85J5L5_TRIRE|nr:unnamed protein product [Trichobilharzia regenti]
MCPAGRNPLPPFIYENDDDFTHLKKKEHKVFNLPPHLAQLEDPWNKLCTQHTLSSLRHTAEYFDPEAPNDDLDFRLKSYYDQHRHWWKSKSEALLQRETINETKRVLKNRPVKVPVKRPPPSQPFPIWTCERRDRLEHVSEAIDGHHSQATNGGYSRKPDGNKFIA